MVRLSVEEYQVGVVCALPKEMMAARAVLDEEHESLQIDAQHDSNNYVLGRIHRHNVVLACLPAGGYGTNSAATVAANMLRTFPHIRFGLMVGIGGGIPNMAKEIDIRLGDIVVSQPDDIHGGVVQYDQGKNLGKGLFERKGALNRPPTVLLTALSSIQAKISLRDEVAKGVSAVVEKPGLAEEGYAFPGIDRDNLFCRQCDRSQSPSWWQIIWLLLFWIYPLWSCAVCVGGKIPRLRTRNDPKIHYGTIASGNSLIKDAAERDRIGNKFGAICVEMEAAGLMNDFPCLVIRGICDYADSFKNDLWQKYAAASAAAFARELLLVINPTVVHVTTRITDTVSASSLKLREKLKNSLDFDERLTRIALIEPREEATFEWLYDVSLGQSSDSLSVWLENTSQPCYWIHGKPGSGKSTLMKALWEDQRTKDYLQKSSQLRNVHILKHSFWLSTSSSMQKSFKGLLCSLMYEVVDLVDVEVLVQDCSEIKSMRKIHDWPENLLENVLVKALSEVRTTAVICIFLDALDEIEQTPKLDKRRILKFIDKVSSLNIKFCVSSRTEPPWSDRFQKTPQLRLEDLTAKDIRTFVSERLEGVLPNDEYDPHFTPHETFLAEVVEKADGMFIWAHLAMSSILNQSTHATWAEIHQRMAQLPPGIYELYNTIIGKHENDIDSVREEAAAYFKVCLDDQLGTNFTVFNRSGILLHQALLIRHMYFRGERLDFYELDKDAYRKDYLQLEKRIQDICGGMLTITYGGCLSKSQYVVSGGSVRLRPMRFKSRAEHSDVPSGLRSINFRPSHRTVADFLNDTPDGRDMIGRCRLSRLDILHAVVEAEIIRLKFWQEQLNPYPFQIILAILTEMMKTICEFKRQNRSTVTDKQLTEVLHRFKSTLSVIEFDGIERPSMRNKDNAADFQLFHIAKQQGRDYDRTVMALDIEGMSLESGITSLFAVEFSQLLLKSNPGRPAISTEYKNYMLLCATKGNLPEAALQLIDSGADFFAEFFLPLREPSKISPAGQLLLLATRKSMDHSTKQQWANVIAKTGSRNTHLLFETFWGSPGDKFLRLRPAQNDDEMLLLALDVGQHLRLWLQDYLSVEESVMSADAAASNMKEHIGFVIFRRPEAGHIAVFPHTIDFWRGLSECDDSGRFPHNLAPACRKCLVDAGDMSWICLMSTTFIQSQAVHEYCNLDSITNLLDRSVPRAKRRFESGRGKSEKAKSTKMGSKDPDFEEPATLQGKRQEIEEAQRKRDAWVKDLVWRKGFFRDPTDASVLQNPIPRFAEHTTPSHTRETSDTHRS